MTLATLTWVTLGACLLYLVTQDPNVYTWLVLQSKVLNVWIQRKWFMLRYNPDSPWVRWEIHRNAKKLADEIIKENKTR
jgi:hypothetical protein